MNNREELMTAMGRGRPARIPYTYEGTAETHARLRAHLGIDDDETIEAQFGCNWFGWPWSGVGKAPKLVEREAGNAEEFERTGQRVDIWGRRKKLVQAGQASYWEAVAPPLADAETVADVDQYDWPSPDELVLPEPPADFDAAVAKAGAPTMLWAYPGVFAVSWGVRGMEKLMMDMVLNPAIVEAIVAHIEAFQLGCMKRIFEAYPGLIDLARSSDDWGAQGGLLISRAMADRFYMPTIGRLYGCAREHGAVAYQHSCGGVYEIIPSLIDAGVEILNPIQTTAAGMDPARLKAEFGSDLCFHGGVDTQGTMVSGTTDDVRAEARSLMDTLGPDGYILAPGHVLQPDVPPENIVALYEEAREYGAA